MDINPANNFNLFKVNNNLPYFKEALLLEMSFNKKSDSICNLSFPKSK